MATETVTVTAGVTNAIVAGPLHGATQRRVCEHNFFEVFMPFTIAKTQSGLVVGGPCLICSIQSIYGHHVGDAELHICVSSIYHKNSSIRSHTSGRGYATRAADAMDSSPERRLSLLPTTQDAVDSDLRIKTVPALAVSRTSLPEAAR